MFNRKSTKSALLTSSIALLLCFSMLLGTTFAWFTDNVTSSNNIIKSGKLDVAMYWADGIADPATAAWTDASTGAIFNNDLWEPGYAEVRHIKIANEGSLALKYKVLIAATGTVSDLADVIDVYYADPAVQVADRTQLTDANKIGTLTEVLAKLGETGYGELAAAEAHTITLAFKMQESAGNEYQNKAIGSEFAIKVVATQLEAEVDSFDKTYDAEAEYPNVNSVNVPANTTTSSILKMDEVKVEIPAGAEEGNYELQVVKTGVETDAEEKTTVSYDINVLKDGAKVSGVEIPVEINVGKYLEIVSLKHNGNDVANYNYDKTTGIVSFKTTSFSPFAVVHRPADVECGIYDEDPALYFASQLGEGKEHISTEIKVGGETKWNVSKTATTVFVDPTTQSGKLYSIISGLQNNEHSTVYLLPGTYNEGTAINVYSSMDIIGLGNAEDINVVKVSGSKCNRHLFNCNGAVSRDTHILVTIRNLTLTATVKNGDGAVKLLDNAAVQSIRLSKVKCYDLIIKKGTGYPFYVNGKYDDRGAYMYVENCVTDTSSIVDTASTYKFYHNNLTYNGGKTYTQNSGSILNKTMEPDNWNW